MYASGVSGGVSLKRELDRFGTRSVRCALVLSLLAGIVFLYRSSSCSSDVVDVAREFANHRRAMTETGNGGAETAPQRATGNGADATDAADAATSAADPYAITGRSRLLVMGMAWGYEVDRLRFLVGSVNVTSGPLRTDAELVLVDPSAVSTPGRRATPLREPRAFAARGVTVLGVTELASDRYMGLLQRPEWSHVRAMFQCARSTFVRFDCSIDMRREPRRLLEHWLTTFNPITMRHLLYLLVMINRIVYGPMPHFVLFTDVGDVHLQRDIRVVLDRDSLWRQWWRAQQRDARSGGDDGGRRPRHPPVTAVSHASTRYDWESAPSLLYVVEEGCLACENANGYWLCGCFGLGMVSCGVEDAYYPGSWRSFNTGEYVGTLRAAVHSETWMLALTSAVGCLMEDQQFLNVLVYRVWSRGGVCVPGALTSNVSVPNVCLVGAGSLAPLDRLYVGHFWAGELAALHCIGLVMHEYFDYTRTYPPVLYSVQALVPGAVQSRVPALLHQYNRWRHPDGLLYERYVRNTTWEQWDAYNLATHPLPFLVDVDEDDGGAFHRIYERGVWVNRQIVIGNATFTQPPAPDEADRARNDSRYT